MERQIGDRFNFYGVKMEVAEAEHTYCTGCYLHEECLVDCDFMQRLGVLSYCTGYRRKDLKFIIFKKVEE